MSSNFFRDDSVNIEHKLILDNHDGIIEGLDASDNSSTATGEGAVSASGQASVVAATGFRSVANVDGHVNQADHGSQVLDGVSGPFQNAFNSPGAVLANDVHHSPINTGTFVGVQAAGDANGAVVGHDNQTTTVLGNANDSAFGQGEATVGNASNNDVHDGAVSGLGGAHNQSHNHLSHGSALSEQGDALGHNVQDQSFHETHTNVSNILHSSGVDTAQDESSVHSHHSFHTDHIVQPEFDHGDDFGHEGFLHA